MRVLLLLAVILSAGFCQAADSQTPATDATANGTVAISVLDAITKKCNASGKTTQQDVELCTLQSSNSDLLRIAISIDKLFTQAKRSHQQEVLDLASCNFDASNDDSSKLIDTLTCVMGQLQKPKPVQNYSLELNVQGLGPGNDVAEESEQKSPDAGANADKGTDTVAPAPASDGEHVGGSLYTSPSTCVTKGRSADNGVALDHPELIGVRRELLAPKEASDVYGHRLGKRYIIYQVRISDYSKDYQYVVHDISLNLWNVLKLQLTDAQRKTAEKLEKRSPSAFLASSRDLDLLRGIPEKGQDYDPRNLTLHILTGLGSVAGGVSGLTAFSDVMGSAVSVFNGAFLQAFVGILPDHTGTQLNRLSDQAFASNTLVDKLHTKVFAIFIPQSLVLDEDHQKTFWKSPRTLLTEYPLDQVDVCVDGSLVTEVSISANPAFSVTDTNVAPGTKVDITDSDTNAVIYFTDVDGTTPTASTTDKYSGTITLPTKIGTTLTLRAIAVSPNKQPSSIASQTYTIQLMPTANRAPAAATTAPIDVTLTPATAGDTLRCTNDGSTPTAASPVCAAPIHITASQTIKAIEVPAAGSPGPVATFNYKLK